MAVPLTIRHVLLWCQSTTLLENWGRILDYQPLIFEHVCHDALQYLEQQADAFRELLRAREKVVKVRRSAYLPA